MSIKIRIIFMFTLNLALFFGFLPLFLPQVTEYNFERLHVFLFNLCTGGTVILYFTEKKMAMTGRTGLFFILSVIYALCAFFKVYLPAVASSFILAFIVESVRIRRFSFLPTNFFKSGIPVREKFHQASLLCLSIGLISSGLVIINSNFYPLIEMPKLKLDVFFLGFSFPVSLITMSVMFSMMRNAVPRNVELMKEACFWSVTLGVIIFFIFILFQKIIPQVIITHVLAAAVVLMFYLFNKLGDHVQQKYFLLSGMCFLLATAVTGIVYIFFMFLPAYNSSDFKWLLKLHAFVSLYGWNLSGLTVIFRYDSFPIQLHNRWIISLHWLTVLLLAPLGIFIKFFSIPAIFTYIAITYLILFSKGSRESFD
jgi:hypothetical protein